MEYGNNTEYWDDMEYWDNRPITAIVTIGNLKIQLKEKHFTKRQIKHIKKYFGFDVENVEQK